MGRLRNRGDIWEGTRSLDRRISSIGALLSMVTTGVICVCWLRSYTAMRYGLSPVIKIGIYQAGIWSANGEVGISQMVNSGAKTPPLNAKWTPNMPLNEPLLDEFGDYQFNTADPPVDLAKWCKSHVGGFGVNDRIIDFGTPQRDFLLVAPYWFVAGIFLSISGLFMARRVRICYQIQRDRCWTCGYDLRASPDRCPECGSLRAR
jgi:hypothetical protein